MKKNDQMILQPYNTGLFAMWPQWLKVMLAKVWVAGAVYYFVGFGMPQLGQGVIDKIFTVGLVLGPLHAMILYPFIKHLSRNKEQYDQYIFIKSESPLRIFSQVFYNWLVVILVAYTYQLINSVINAVMHYEKGVIKFGVEPILFGGFYFLIDYLLIKAKHKFRKRQ